MKPEISSYCQRVETVLAPFLDDIDSFLAEDDPLIADEGLAESFEPLNFPVKELKKVLEKVREQNAFVLIFGPLKSGKSTLMNALSRDYVSEVTALPAYPCLVYVKYAETPYFKIRFYNGDVLEPADNDEMNQLIEQEHRKLAEEVRKAEEAGELFDPHTHYPQAIESYEVGVPANHLEEGQTILVDTPGLYSRMKFGYDLMTRQFRDRAACAIFVVKSDNLFLEQVFAEFGDLLALFSRIFLVVNIDSQKRDLTPDGKLRPSLEARSPEQVIQAFESYAMSAALRKAYQDGRLKIFPIDLLTASSNVLQGNTSPAPENINSEDEEEDSAAEEGSGFPIPSASSADQPVNKDTFIQSFSRFENELTEYLNGSEYLNDFREDIHRRVLTSLHTIQDELVANLFNPLEQRISSAKEELQITERKKRAIQDLTAFNWPKAMAGLSGLMDSVNREFVIKERKQLEESLNKSLETWLQNDETIEGLLQTQWNAQLESSRRKSRDILAKNIEGTLGRVPLGFTPDQKIQSALEDLGVTPSSLRDKMWSQTLETLPSQQGWTLDLDREAIPLKKSFWQIVLFRSRKSICRKLFTASEEKGSLDPSLKDKHFGESAKVYLQEKLSEHVASLYPEALNQLGKALTQHYGQTVGYYFGKTLKDEGARLAIRVPELKQRIRKLEDLVSNLNTTRNRTQELTEDFQPDNAQVFGKRSE